MISYEDYDLDWEDTASDGSSTDSGSSSESSHTDAPQRVAKNYKVRITVKRNDGTKNSQELQDLPIEEQISYLKETVLPGVPEGTVEHTLLVDVLADTILQLFERSGDLVQLEEVIMYRREMLLMRPPSDPNRPVSLAKLAEVVQERYEKVASSEDSEEAISLYEEALSMYPSPDPDRSDTLSTLAGLLLNRFKRLGVAEDINRAILLYREDRELCAPPHPCSSVVLENLGLALYTRYEQLESKEDLEEAIEIQREALSMCSSSQGNRILILNNLASSIVNKFTRSGLTEDIDEAVRLFREGLLLRPPAHVDHSEALSNLSHALRGRFQRFKGRDDLDEVISIYETVLRMKEESDLDRIKVIDDLADALVMRFDEFQTGLDTEEAVRLRREGFQSMLLSDHDDSDLIDAMSNLAHALHKRFEYSGAKEDLDEAGLLHREVLSLRPSSHPDHSTCLSNLAATLFYRFEKFGIKEDLQESIKLSKEVVLLRPPPHSNRSTALNNLAGAIVRRFEELGEGSNDDIEEAIGLFREALQICPPSDSSRSYCVNNLAMAIGQRFKQLGARRDLDEAILLNREAILLRPPPDPNRPTTLSNLAILLLRRFDLSNEREDMDEAVQLDREALMLRSSFHPSRFMTVINLGTTLSKRFERFGNKEDLDEATALYREGLCLNPPPHPNRPTALNNLGLALQKQFSLSGDEKALDEAIVLHRESVSLLPIAHTHRPMSIGNLADAYSERFQSFGALADLEETISLYQEALDLVDAANSARAGHALAVGNERLHLFDIQKVPEILNRALDSFRIATDSIASPISTRLRASTIWARRAEANNHITTMEAYEHSINFLPRLASLADNVHRRQEVLTEADGLAQRAAAHAISLKEYAKAVEFLEAGRGIFWLQSLQLRSPIDQLNDVAPDLAHRLSQISSELEKGSYIDRSSGAVPVNGQSSQSRDRQISHFNQLNDQWEKTLDDVRKINGFEEFLQPRKFSTLQEAAHDVPIIILIATDSDSHALIVTASDVRHAHLPNINITSARSLTSKVRASATMSRRDQMANQCDTASNTRDHDRYGRPVRRVNTVEDNFLELVLKTLWKVVVHPIILELNLVKSKSPPIIRWCPTGIFSFLPLHAAGLYRADMSSIDCTPEYMISSYTPTINVLLSRQHDHRLPTMPKMTVILEPRTLPSTIIELQKITNHVSDDHLVKLGFPEVATINQALAHISTSSIVHFACHGRQFSDIPLESALLLDDGDLKISRIMQLRMPNAALAFLCACETAMGDEKVPDEAMHIGASLLFAGFRTVIATMWSISDADGPIVADAFYEHLCRNNLYLSKFPDPTHSAEALHVATAKLRLEGASFRRWVPFIHLGI